VDNVSFQNPSLVKKWEVIVELGEIDIYFTMLSCMPLKSILVAFSDL